MWHNLSIKRLSAKPRKYKWNRKLYRKCFCTLFYPCHRVPHSAGRAGCPTRWILYRPACKRCHPAVIKMVDLPKQYVTLCSFSSLGPTQTGESALPPSLPSLVTSAGVVAFTLLRRWANLQPALVKHCWCMPTQLYTCRPHARLQLRYRWGHLVTGDWTGSET